MRCGPIGSRITREIYNRVKSAGSKIETVILYASLPICRKSTEKRWAAGGHPAREEYLLQSFDEIPEALPMLKAKSDSVKYYLRSQADQVPILVAETGEDGKSYSEGCDRLAVLKTIMKKDNPAIDLKFLEVDRSIPSRENGSHDPYFRR